MGVIMWVDSQPAICTISDDVVSWETAAQLEMSKSYFDFLHLIQKMSSLKKMLFENQSLVEL